MRPKSAVFLFYLFLAPALFFACSTPLNEAQSLRSNSLPSIKVDSNIDHSIQDILPLQNIDTIYLETSEESLFGNIDKIQIHHNRLFVLDKGVTKSVYIFNQEGRYINKIHSVGSGLGEYYLPFDMAINTETDRLEIMDVRNRKILSYDLGGQFIEEWAIEGQLMDFFPLSKEHYVFHRDGRDLDTSKRHNLLIIANRSFNQIFREGVMDYGISDYLRVFKSLAKTHDRLLYMHPMQDTIYQVSLDSIRPVYAIDFLEKKLPYQSKANARDMMELYMELRASDYYLHSGNILESSALITFLWERKERGWQALGEDFEAEYFLAIYHKDSGATISLPNTSSNPHWTAPIYAHDDFFYSVLYPQSIQEGMFDEANPIIIRYSIKPF